MDLETLHFLISPDGEKLLKLTQSLEGTLLQKLTVLRKQYPAQVASAAIELIDLRKRATAKFSRAIEMFFIREALEQASGEVISTYRAERYEKDSQVLDLACGIGGDTIALGILEYREGGIAGRLAGRIGGPGVPCIAEPETGREHIRISHIGFAGLPPCPSLPGMHLL